MDRLEFKGKWNEWKGKINKPMPILQKMICCMKNEKMMKVREARAQKERQEQVRRNALAKLSDEEKKLLGLR